MALAAGVLLAGGTRMRGQAVAPAPSTAGAVVGTGTFTAFVENMDRSLAFYHDAFGMDVPPLPATGERPYNQANPQLFDMFDIAGAKERHQSARMAGTAVNVELMEIQNVDHKVIPMRSQDPGTATLVFIVRDLDAAIARVKDARGTIVTPGGAPVMLADRSRALLIRDADSRPVELRQAPGTPVAAAATTSRAANLLEHRISIAVDDLDKTMRVYRELLGFSGTSDEKFTADPGTRALTGLKGIEVRRGRVQAPGSMLTIEFVEYKGIDREPHAMRIQDRGAARLQLRAQNVDALVESMKRAGLKVMSVGGVAVPIPPNLKGALVADPNNFFLTPFAPCDGCAPTLAPVARGR
jgi:catechol 2,3-dioxygenase-like lactoylglutathione lyase family enzyme